MTAKEFLQLPGDYIRECDALEEKINDWRQRAALPSGIDLSEWMASKGAKKDLSDYVAKIEALLQRRIRAYGIYLDYKKMVFDMLMDMDDAKETAVLYYRYLLFWKWDRIAEAFKCASQRNAHRIHGEALQHFEEKYASFLASF